ncbi:MAG: Gfo/Idh/MocA family protein, partial [Acetobacteraceae bacterium]
MTVNVGVIGTGMIGQYHMARLAERLAGSRVVAVADLDAGRAASVAAGVPGARAFATGQDLIRDDGVDAVLVTSWGATHEAFVLAAIAARKPVFCEKPLATDQAA